MFTNDPRELSAALPTMIMPDAPLPLWRAIEQAMERLVRRTTVAK